MEYASSRQEIAAEVVTHFTADAEEQRRYQKALARNISKPSRGLLNQLPAASSVRKWSFGRQMQTLLSLHIFFTSESRGVSATKPTNVMKTALSAMVPLDSDQGCEHDKGKP